MESQSSGDRGPENCWETLDEGVKRAVILLRDFARQKEKDFEFVLNLSPSDLGSFLKDFFISIKDQPQQPPTNGEEEKPGNASLVKIRTDLSEYFKKAMNVDISSGNDFSESNAVVEEGTSQQAKENTGAAVKNVVMKKHTRQRTFTFETNELRQIYMSEAMNLDQPESLQNKVFFDVCMYICNRGKDFLRLMTKSDFEVCTDEHGRRYVRLKYDPKFSFNEVAGGLSSEAARGSQIGERMYERAGDPKCPVLSYTQYVIHLHPMSDAFWQRPKRSVLPTDIVWYDNQSIGNSTLNKLMNRITQAAGLPDSYAINAIKPSYIPIIESICRSALFGSQQFRRILHMKQGHQDMHYHVRKRHSEGSLSIASVLQESPLFRPRHSEPQLPVYRPHNVDISEMVRSSSTSPVPRTGGGWDPGSPHMVMRNTPERRDTPETGYQSMPSAGFKTSYREPIQNGAQDLSTKPGNSSSQHYREGEMKPEPGSILHAKQKCLDIVHSLEVRDIKSFINWMKTFEVKHGPSGLMVTCQPVAAGDSQQQQQQQEVSRGTDQSCMNGYTSPTQESVSRKNSLQHMRVCREFEPKDLEFDCIGDTFCCTSDVAPVKITIPAQDTLLLTGLQADNQVLIHRKIEEKQSPLDEKYSPLHQRVLLSNDNYGLQQVDTVMLHKPPFPDRQISHDNNSNSESSRSNCYKEDKSMPMKKRIVMDQEAHNISSPQQAGSPLGYPTQSRSPPSFSSQHSSPHSFMPMSLPGPGPGPGPSGPTTGPPGVMSQNPPYILPPGAPQMHPAMLSGMSSVPKYRESFPEGWGYFPMQKRQKFGIQGNNSKDCAPLDLIKQS